MAIANLSTCDTSIDSIASSCEAEEDVQMISVTLWSGSAPTVQYAQKGGCPMCCFEPYDSFRMVRVHSREPVSMQILDTQYRR